MKTIDINCDMGESPQAIADGTQEALMQYISSANIACGGHAGDAKAMRATIDQALRHNVCIGAHPGYEDRANFGRTELQLSPEAIAALVHRQILDLNEIASRQGAKIFHVKAHGALYNQAARNREIARAIAEGVRRWNPSAIMVGLAGSAMLDEFRAAGFPVAAEAFADRRYEPDGTLRSRKFPDALLTNPNEAATQALRIVKESSVIAANGTVLPLAAQTLCLHGDTPNALSIASELHHQLRAAGIQIRSLEATS
jgi:5-oxoprolinase (ATP-hydrolysing) subunit A